MILSLTGFMGSGKTTVGLAVADMLGCPFVDLDDLIARKAGKSIPRLFSEDGEAAFRALEARCLADTVKKYAEGTAVLSLGGGTPENAASLRLIREKTVCIYLKASFETLMERLSGGADGRPMLQGDVSALYERRLPIYEEAAHITLETDGHSPEEIADEIIVDCL